MISKQTKQLLKDFAIVFKTAEGERVVSDLMNKFHILSPVTTEVEEGERRVVLYILSRLNWKSTDVTKKVKEILDDD